MGLLEPRLRLGDLLISRGYLTPQQLEVALTEQAQQETPKLLGEHLVERGHCTEEQVLECVAVSFGLPYVELDSRLFDPKVFDQLPREVIEKHVVLPLFRVRDRLSVAVSDPSNVFLLDRLRDLADCEIQVAVASAKDIRRMVQTYMPNTRVFVIDDIIDDANGNDVELIEESLDDIGVDAEVAGQSPIVRLVNYIIYTGVREGASDIHIEPTDRQLRIRYRLDGVLHELLHPPVHLAPAVASRIKIMASLDISERRLPQDGRIQVMLDGRAVDLRVSTMPLAHGEKVVVRILDNQNVDLTIDKLGFSADVLQTFESQIIAPNGIVLVTGPTGSGKSTTLYSALQCVSSIEKNICTVEDPIELQLAYVNQSQVNEKIGLSFATILRSMLRQDPDIIMVGEIRDEETARVAIQAALTGHLVMSTLHTNDACSTLTRLVDMGVESYLVGASLNMVLAQRLCRKICAKCKQQYDPPHPMLLAFEQSGLNCGQFMRGVGCVNCRGTGFSGRIAIHEMLVVDDELREAISTNPKSTVVRDYARAHGMVPLRFDGFLKVKEGITTLEEVFRVSQDGWNPKKAVERMAV